jgi:hypothetical protein
MSMRLFAALFLASMMAVLLAAGCGNDSKAGCNPDDCAPVKCPEGERRGCIDGACVTDAKVLCAGQT